MRYIAIMLLGLAWGTPLCAQRPWPPLAEEAVALVDSVVSEWENGPNVAAESYRHQNRIATRLHYTLTLPDMPEHVFQAAVARIEAVVRNESTDFGPRGYLIGTLAALDAPDQPERVPNIHRTLIEVYRSTSDRVMRLVIINVIGLQRHKDRAAAFLEEVARTDSVEVVATQAVEALDKLDGVAVPALRRIMADSNAHFMARGSAESFLRARGEISR